MLHVYMSKFFSNGHHRDKNMSERLFAAFADADIQKLVLRQRLR